jgi:hypothetical protein
MCTRWRRSEQREGLRRRDAGGAAAYRYRDGESARVRETERTRDIERGTSSVCVRQSVCERERTRGRRRSEQREGERERERERSTTLRDGACQGYAGARVAGWEYGGRRGGGR